jgi:hypothetical protein
LEIAVFALFSRKTSKKAKKVIFGKSFFKPPTKIKIVSNVISRLKMTFKHILEHESEGKNEFSKNGGKHE